MKINLIKLNIFIMILFSVNIMAQDCTSSIVVNSNDSSAVIYLNNALAGHGNTTLEVPKGKYIILAKSSSRRWDAEEILDSVLITDCGIKKELNLSFKKDIYLNTIPANAEVYYRDSLIGSTPLYLASEITQVNVKKKDYRSETIFPEKLSEGSLIKLDFIGKKNGQSFLRTNMFKILLGSALVLGGTAAYYKLKANNYFDDYNQTGNQTALDQTNKYDMISGIAFGALQVNFGVILYYLLTEQ